MPWRVQISRSNCRCLVSRSEAVSSLAMKPRAIAAKRLISRIGAEQTGQAPSGASAWENERRQLWHQRYVLGEPTRAITEAKRGAEIPRRLSERLDSSRR